MTSFVLVNQCSDPELTPELLNRIAVAIDVQLNRDVAPHWGGSYRVRAATPDNPPADGEIVVLIVDALPTQPVMVAYHTWTGHPEIYEARAMVRSLVDGDLSLSQAMSHEIIETVIDPACNEYCDEGTGTEWPKEGCDVVESGWYLLPGNIACADFVFPEFFEPGSTGPYSYVNEQHQGGAFAPFTVAPGGYSDNRVVGTGQRVTVGDIRAERRAKKDHWSSRRSRRLAQMDPQADVPTTPATPASLHPPRE